MDIETIALSEPDASGREEELICAVLGSAEWSGGPMLESFERAFAGWCGRAHAVAVASGTLGTWIALRALGIGPGDEVVCAAHTWHQVAQAITLAGATPVFADIDYWSGCLSAEKAALKIGPKTRAILAGNTNGHPAAWGPLRTLADAHGLKLVEDSTEALGSRYLGRAVGSFGDVSVFDFSQPSALCTGEGGMLLTDDDALAERCRSLRNLCFQAGRRFVHAELGWNLRMSNLQAALGVAQLERLDEFIARKRETGRRYDRWLAPIASIERQPARTEQADNIYWVNGVVLKDEVPFDAEEAMKRLAGLGVGTRPFFWPMHEQPVFRAMGLFEGERHPVAERIARRGFYLPSGVALTPEQTDAAAAALTGILA